MPDISMCCNTKCPSREKCYRYRAKPGLRQSYAPYSNEDGESDCGSFVSVIGWHSSYLIPEGSIVKDLFEDSEVKNG